MSKNTKKWIVNGLTFSRVITTLLLPVLCTIMSSTSFMLLIGAVLFTDFLDGKLARRWEVCTLFGSLSDMGADKLLGISLLTVLAVSYPIMAIPACLEIGIASVNTKSVLKGNKAKSKITGKIKMGVSFVSILSLLMIGASPEIANILSNINIDVNIFKELSNKIQELFKFDSDIITELCVSIDNDLSFLKEKFISYSKNIVDFIINNEETIKNTVIPATIASETATLVDYAKDYNKVKDNESKKLLEELRRYKEYIKDYKFKKYMKEIMFDEEYHEKTQDEPLIKKLMPNKNKMVDK